MTPVIGTCLAARILPVYSDNARLVAGLLHVKWDVRGAEFLQAPHSSVQREADRDHRNQYAHDQRQLLLGGRGANQKAGLQILRSIAGIGRRNANHTADLMASAKKAGAVQPMTRNMAQVAMRVAMAMPEIGFEDVPISPVMRDETVTKRNPKTTTRSAATGY